MHDRIVPPIELINEIKGRFSSSEYWYDKSIGHGRGHVGNA